MTDFALLPSIEIETAPSPDASLIFLHGLGDDGHGWSDVVPAMALPGTLAIRCIFPHAPEMAVTINGGYVMPAWYDLLDTDFESRADLHGVRLSRTHIEHLIARERHRGIRAARIVLGGFSQGGAVALYAGLLHEERLAGITALSAYLVDPEATLQQATSANRSTPIFMAHGTADDVVRYAWGDASRRRLEAAGWPVEWHTYPIAHSAVLEEIVALGAFVSKVLA